MKRAALLRTIAEAARRNRSDWRLIRDRGDHEVWSLDGIPVVIPRHREVNEMVALPILVDLEARFGERWWHR